MSAQSDPMPTSLRTTYESVVGLPAGERDEVLERACAGAPELMRRVRRLLATHDRAGRFLASPMVEVGAVDEAEDGRTGSSTR